jgi:uncharacterized protein (DUF58 family)
MQTTTTPPFWKRWLHDQLVAPIGTSVVIARRYHFGAGGAAYALTTLVLVIGAVNGQNNLLFVIFGSAVAGMLLSGIISGWGMMGLRLTRHQPPTMRVGERASVHYAIENKARLIPACGLLIEELPRATSTVGASFSSTVEPGLATVRASVQRVAPRGQESAEAFVLPRARGRYSLTPMRVSSAFPLGLTRKSVTFAQQDSVTIRPARVRLPLAIGAAAPTGDEQGGGRPSRTGSEFFSLRDYQSGDSPRSIAWRATARSDTPIVRSTITPPGERSWVVLDLASVTLRGSVEKSASQDRLAQEGTSHAVAIEEIIAVGASVCERLLERGHEVGVRSGRGDVLVPLCRGLASVPSMLDTLALLRASEHMNASSAHAMPQGSLLWVCDGAPSVAVPAGSTLLSTRDASIRAALDESPAVLAPDNAEGGALGLPTNWLGSVLGELWGKATDAGRSLFLKPANIASTPAPRTPALRSPASGTSRGGTP